MVEPKLGSHRKRRPAMQSLDGWQEDLFFHTDMPQEPRAKLMVRRLVHQAGLTPRRLKQRIKPPVVLRKKPGNRPMSFLPSLSHRSPVVLFACRFIA
jgi:hypothetical protein